MARENTPRWERWSGDPRVEFASSNGGLRVRVPAQDGWPTESGWCKLIGYNVDVTVRQLIRELGWTPKPALVLNDQPRIDPDRDVIYVRADIPAGGRFPINVSRRYVEDVWGVAWKEALEAFAARTPEVMAAAEREHAAGKDKLELFVRS